MLTPEVFCFWEILNRKKNEGETASDESKLWTPSTNVVLTKKLLREKQQSKTKGKKLQFHGSNAVILGDYFNYIQLLSILDDKADD